MIMHDDEKLEGLRADVGRAVQAFAEYQQELFWDREKVAVLGWVVSFEASSPDMERQEQSLPGVITPDGQMAATSVGLLVSGRRAWTPLAME